MIILTGPLAAPQMLAALGLEGRPVPMTGRLEGGKAAGIALDAWPVLIAADQPLAAVAVARTPALSRYCEIMGLVPVIYGGREVLGVVLAHAQDAHAPKSHAQDAGAGDGAAARPPQNGDWPADYAAALARALVAIDPARPAASIRARLPRIGDWVAAKLRAARETPARIGPPAGPDGARFEITSVTEPYAHFFSLEDVRLRHRRYRGDWSGTLERAVFVSGDAVVVLPWDPVRDRVMLIDQFRVAPALRGDNEPWLYEAVAGRIDQLETPQEAALREAREEAGITLGRLIPAPHHYPSPGASAEMLYLFLGIADLPDGSDGLGGLESEAEDIRSHVIDREALAGMVRQGLIRNGPLLVLALWLEAEAGRIRAEYTSR